MLKKMIDAAKLKWNRSIQEEYDRDAEIRSKIHIGRSAEGTAFEIVVAILNIALWGITIHLRNLGFIAWAVAAIGTFISVVFCCVAYDPAIMAEIDLPKEKRQPVHFSLAVRYNRLSAVFCALIAIFGLLAISDRSYLSMTKVMLVLEGIVFLGYQLLLWLKY